MNPSPKEQYKWRVAFLTIALFLILYYYGIIG